MTRLWLWSDLKLVEQVNYLYVFGKYSLILLFVVFVE